MKSYDDLEPDTYLDAVDEVTESLNRLERSIMASMMTMYPDRQSLINKADDLRVELNADTIEINVILPGKQLTIVSCPGKNTVVRELNLTDSVCTLTVGYDEALTVSDIKNSNFLEDHIIKSFWGTWASTPLRLNGFPVGTVCALGDEPRVWTDAEEAKMTKTCDMIEADVTQWLADREAEK